MAVAFATETTAKLKAELEELLKKKPDAEPAQDGQVLEVGVTVTGIIRHEQLVGLVNLATATSSYLYSKRSGAGQRFYYKAEPLPEAELVRQFPAALSER